MKGFTIFFAMLVGSLTLAIGLAIYDLTVRELNLSEVASQSQYAIYAADSGVECALYWDSKYADSDGSAFGTSSASTWGSNIRCNNQILDTGGLPPDPVVAPPTGWTAWDNTSQRTSSSATTTFILTMLPIQNSCASVQVGKATIGGVLYTTIISRGFNNCNSVQTGPRVQRTLRVSY